MPAISFHGVIVVSLTCTENLSASKKQSELVASAIEIRETVLEIKHLLNIALVTKNSDISLYSTSEKTPKDLLMNAMRRNYDTIKNKCQ